MHIKTIPVGQLETNCYVVADETTRECAVIDPGADSNAILDYIESSNLTVRAIFITHAHFDHITALPEVERETGAPIYVNERELEGDNQRAELKLRSNDNLRFYADGDVVTVGSLNFEVLDTPGHTLGSVCLRCGDALFTGDTLFRDSCGRTDIGGDMDLMLDSLKRLSALDGDYEVFPGHAEATTLDNERRFNYYVRYANDDLPALRD
ncbi:MAG: MBL fold metallo-hydrolase [Oscillospiraceae bacterium]|jgi:glyoxylase-like metal-dependent hydrolase (beta-lactamase superfamily II)|nr:MBL fold metallo-hydrolase [Oscillospiraceae bacterium]